MEKVTAKSYTLRKEDGSWLGQIVLTSDGMFSSVTDYGKFVAGLDKQYFGGKMYQGMTYMIHGKQYEKACHRFAEEILPALKLALNKELELETV